MRVAWEPNKARDIAWLLFGHGSVKDEASPIAAGAPNEAEPGKSAGSDEADGQKQPASLRDRLRTLGIKAKGKANSFAEIPTKAANKNSAGLPSFRPNRLVANLAQTDQNRRMNHNRRKFIRSAALAAGAVCAFQVTSTQAAKGLANPIAFFEKPLQSLSFDELADFLARIGFDGVEATVRKGGHIEPENAAKQLPQMAEALKRRNLEILVMASSINSVEQPHAETTLRAAAKAGVRIYRLAGLRYDLKQPILPQLDAFAPQLRKLAALNSELGLTAVYQNHAGSSNVGGPIWDLAYLMREFDPNEIAVAYDIRHAMVEGSSAWPVSFQLIRPRVKAVYVKDFVFDNGKAKNVPMGEGHVGKKFYQTLKQSGYTGPISIHSPHLRARSKSEALAARPAIQRDLAQLKQLLANA
jgi:sugar phosphate isomerase/epimerase